MPSEAERKAAFDVAEAGVLRIAKKFVPFMFESQAEAAIRNNPSVVQSLVDDILEAAEGERKK
jgi:pyruvate/2-oxoglutarate/acetoin dehydrogenase E1 component